MFPSAPSLLLCSTWRLAPQASLSDAINEAAQTLLPEVACKSGLSDADAQLALDAIVAEAIRLKRAAEVRARAWS